MFRDLALIAERLARYQQSEIPDAIAPDDGMWSNSDHYFGVGADAIAVIARGMIAARQATAASVLDLPCGFGRVTRHLGAFLPESVVYAADIDPTMTAFVADKFGAIPFAFDATFREPRSMQFDVIWVGSLLTHLPIETTMQALRWFCQAMTQSGVLIVTTSGRAHERAGKHPDMPAERWNEMLAGYSTIGIGYSADHGTPQIGHTMIRPSWLIQQIENIPGARIVGFEEAGWVRAQDVLFVARSPDH